MCCSQQDLHAFLQTLFEPWGFGSDYKASRREVLNKIRRLHLQIFEGNCVHFKVRLRCSLTLVLCLFVFLFLTRQNFLVALFLLRGVSHDGKGGRVGGSSPAATVAAVRACFCRPDPIRPFLPCVQRSSRYFSSTYAELLLLPKMTSLRRNALIAPCGA